MTRRCVALVILFLALLVTPAPAHAASNDVIRDLSIEIDVRPDGILEVTETYDWDFGSRQGLGLTRELDARFDYDDENIRVYRYDNVAVTSPTNAPAGVWSRERGGKVVLDIGAPDGSSDRRSGRQTYVLTYTVEGALNAIRGQEGVSDRDELYWNATGHDWNIPIEQSSVVVRGPAGVMDHACYEGRRGSTDGCASQSASGSEVSVSSGRLDPGEGMTVMAAYPVGTFGEITPILRQRSSGFGSAHEPRAVAAVGQFVRGNAAWLTPIGLALPVAYGLRRRRRGRDEYFTDLPPGVLPPPGAEPRVEQLSSEPTVAVRFTPPDGLRPGEIGALDAKATTTAHVSATIIDLAVRGFLRLEEAGTNWRGVTNDWTLVATPQGAPRQELRQYERLLLAELFKGRTHVQLSTLRNTFASTMRHVRQQIAKGLHDKRLMSRPPRASTTRRGLTLLPVILFFGLFFNAAHQLISEAAGGSGALLFALAIGLIAAFVLARRLTRHASYPRTAAGRALHEQSRGFELYLSTAEANQLRFEEGEDLFSHYLPYATVYGVAERWSAIFAELEAQGVRVERPTWYSGSHGHAPTSFGSLGSSLSSFSSTAGSTLSSTPGSSGGSGSSGGGGGSSGGGGGGGGGGGR